MAHATSSDPNVFILPDLGEGVHEAELISWKVKPGDSVEEHQTLAEMETDKALVEVPSPRRGVIQTLHGKEGEILKVGNPLVTYQGGGGGSATAPSGRGPREAGGEGMAPPAARHAPRGPEPSLAKPRSDSASGRDNGRDEEREDAGTVVGSVSNEPLLKGAGGGKALATPAVRRLARDLGVDIDSVAGTGLAGRVTEKDVRSAATGGAGARGGSATSPSGRGPRAAGGEGMPSARRPAPQQPEPSLPKPRSDSASGAAPAPARMAPPAAGQTQRVPFRGVRRTIAQRLRQSVDTAVHFTVMDEADVSALDAVRKRVAAASGEKVSFLPFVISAMCRALREFPSLNATVDDEAQEILRHPSVHIGVATDTEHGLTVPVIPDCDAMGVLEISRHVADVARAARDRSIPRERLMGSTITISNVGSYAGRFATPVINYPEVAILAVGRVREGVVVRGGGLHVGRLMPLSLACDHRVVDGAEGARCLARIIELLQDEAESLLGPARG